MQQGEIKAARLLPKERWSKCIRCGTEIPEFEFSPEFQLRLSSLIEKHKVIQTMGELRAASGCEVKIAKAWAFHQMYPSADSDPEQYACPHCGKRLRTPRAKQCRFCGRDWH